MLLATHPPEIQGARKLRMALHATSGIGRILTRPSCGYERDILLHGRVLDRIDDTEIVWGSGCSLKLICSVMRSFGCYVDG